jgi:hypothetical protein
MFASYDQIVQNFHKGFKNTPQGETEDPTYLGFKFIFEFHPSHRDPLDKMTHDALFAEADNPHGLESAEEYLMNIGYVEKAKMLRAFKQNLEYINNKTPYYFQSVEGVGDLWKVEKGETFNSFRGKDKVLTINCLESIDMRITSLADMYRKATFDYVAMRELLPENLRHFTMVLQVAEMRKFHRIKSAVENVSTTDQGVIENPTNGTLQVSLEEVTDLISILQFKLEYCEFDFDESWPTENLSHAEMEMAKQKFKIKVGRIREYNMYSQIKSFDDSYVALADSYGVDDRSRVNIKDGNVPDRTLLKDQIKSPNELGSAFSKSSNYSTLGTLVGGSISDLQKKLERAPGDLVARGLNQLQERVRDRVLGNVYGDARSQSSLGAILNGFLNREDQFTVPAGDNVYPAQQPVPPTLGKEDVYPNVPEPPKDSPTDLGNVFK